MPNREAIAEEIGSVVFVASSGRLSYREGISADVGKCFTEMRSSDIRPEVAPPGISIRCF